MDELKVTRRAALIGSALTTAWAASPARALLQAAGAGAVPRMVDDLIARMTPEEKAGQLQIMPAAWAGGVAIAQNPPTNGPDFDGQVAEAVAGRITGVFNGNGAEMARRMQAAVMERSRLKIPLIFAADIIHGHRTIFPVPLAEAASFDPDMAERTARAAALEASASGIDWTFAPMVDIARDSRWGRIVEGAGEDTQLGNLFAAARVRGFEGRGLARDDTMMSCAKHFAAYGAAEAGLDYNTVDVSERTLREVYFPPFQSAFAAGARTTMASFNELSGVPAHGNDWLLTQILRREWGFDGFVVGDYTGDEEMIAHGFAADAREATRIAFMAGTDMSMASGFYRDHLPSLIASGEVPMARVDESVRRVLALKARLGLFDDPMRRIDVRRERARTRTREMLALSREAAAKSIVMLKNEGDLLPLPKSGRRIALIGPFAEGQHDINGPWVVYGDNADSVDLATGIRAKLGRGAQVTVTEGSGIDAPVEGGIEAAVAAANAADVVLLAIGEAENFSGEAQSRTEIVVPPAQQALAEAVAATGKPVVVLLKNGRALALEGAVRDAPAILVTWFLGTESGHGIADVLFGDHSPSARLPISFPRESGQSPFYYNHKPTGRPQAPGATGPYRTYWRSGANAAGFPFGHGLTYGVIEYGDLAIGQDARLRWDGAIEVAARVRNSGRRAAEETVQLYIRDRVASITRPVRELKAFRKVRLAPGASELVRFRLTRPQLEFIGRDLRPTVEPGTFDIWIAPSAEAEGVHGTFELVR